MNRVRRMVGLLALLAAPFLASAAPLPHQVYIWQRAWTPAVQAAVVTHGSEFQEEAVLMAEVSWKNQLPQVARAEVDFAALAKLQRPVGVVLRVGPFHGALSEDKPAVDYLAGLAATLVAEAQANRVQPVELQIDFDCAESKLEDYQIWLQAVQRRLAPVPVTVTVLPSWLNSPVFPRLVASATNYILQVHSLHQPTEMQTPFVLCDGVEAKRAVVKASKVGVPFRVALPTYGYLVAFNPSGKFAGLAAEAPHGSWPAGTQLREMRADPLAMSSLVQDWNTNRPAGLTGVIWYRLPVAEDNLSWRWPTLGAIISARVPQEKFHAETHRVESGLVEISLINDGELDISSWIVIEMHWPDGRLVAGDGLGGFELAESNNSAATLQNQSASFRLFAGEKQVAGWLRFDQQREVQLEVKKF